ncbi:MAG: glucose-6-phosphate isomerase [Bacteroidales bacterium]|nr:glucose-6-phosphate isomerase [Bacteroidales bacterium]MCF8389383.1 glucose-6-phosphate isomerase [Bacteroidales bacterium]
MKNFRLDISKIHNFVSKEEVFSFSEEAQKQLSSLHNKTGEGSDFLGWVDLPSQISENEIQSIEKCANELANKVDFVVVIGIGGSYLGAKFFLEAMSSSFEWLENKGKYPRVLFAGQNLVEEYIVELSALLKGKKFGIVVISKSGTTTEPAVAFRILKNQLEEQVGKDQAKELIIAITDAKKGALRKLANIEGYQSFVIPDDAGGRYSVLTPVGLLPIAIAGYSIREFINGAKKMESLTSPEVSFEENPAAIYAATRHALYLKGKKIEILANYHDKLVYLSEWWKQLYGESEGKENKGIFPASVYFTADLHSMGQYIQEGERHIFETVISVTGSDKTMKIPSDIDNLDQLNYIANKRISEVNSKAELGTMLAHVDGGVPNIRIEIDRINEYNLGLLVYFFEKACGISGYLLNINPFNQPGVEAYKTNMFALLEKPGFEKETEEIKKRL